MSNTITIELCAEDRKRIDELIAFAGLIAGTLKSPEPVNMQSPVQVRTLPLITAAPANEHPVDEVSPHGQPEPVAEPELPKYTKADILAKVQTLATPGHPKREEAKAIVKSYGAKVSDIPEDKYNEVMDKLTALEG